MSRPGDELGQLWALVAELTEQTAHNQALIKQLKERSENVKGQSTHVGAGFPLRRFNLDITDEEFQTELERFASHLVLENQSLQFENKQLNALLKEYETTLEQVMGKFRGVAHASQQHDLALHSYYSSLLQTLQTAHSSALLHDNTSLSLLLTRLSTLLRSALRSLGGEDPEFDLAGLIEEANGIGLINANGNGISPTQRHVQIERDGSDIPGPSSPRSAASPRATTSRRIQHPPQRAAPFPGSIPGSSGGYSGTEGQTDWAMEREMEILRLEEENASLRQLLAIAEESPAADIVEEQLKEEREHESPPIEPQGRRKSSLTIEELEAGAEEEELARASLDRNMPGVQEVLDHGLHGPGTGLGGGAGVGGTESHRPRMDQGALGFKPEAQEGSAIDDGQDGPEGSVEPVGDDETGEVTEAGATETDAPVEEVHVSEVVLGEGEEGKAL